MAITYADLFSDIEEMIIGIEEMETFMATLESRRNTINTQLIASGIENLIGNVNEVFDGAISQIESLTTQVTSLISRRLTDRETVLEQLPQLTSSGVDNVLNAIVADMITNNQTIKKSVVTITPGAETTANTNTGTLITTKLLPGNESPGQGIQRNRKYAGVASEFPLDDNIRIICSNDSQEGSTEGAETFTITGEEPPQRLAFEYNQGGNRGVASLVVSDGLNLVTNFFEDFTTNLPDGWTASVGDAGTDFLEETSDVYIGSSALLIANDGTIDLRYDILSLIEPGQVMCLYFYLKRGSAVAGSLGVDVNINGSAIVNETITVDSTYDDYALYNVVFTVPDVIGTAAYIRFEADPPGVNILIDGGGLVPMTYHAGVGYALIRDTDAFINGDVFPVAIANDDAGRLSRYFTRAHRVQLPSDASPIFVEA